MKPKPETYESALNIRELTIVDDHLGVAVWALGIAKSRLESAHKKSRGKRRENIDLALAEVEMSEGLIRGKDGGEG